MQGDAGRRVDDLRLGYLSPKENILVRRRMKQYRFLRYKSDMLPQRLALILSDGMLIDDDLTGVRIYQSKK